MKVIVLHGEGVEKSFTRLKKFIDTAKVRGWEILYDEISVTPSLFGADRLTVIRDFRLIDKKLLAKATGTLVIYNEGEIGKTFLKVLPKDTKVEEFKLPKLIWNFLEGIQPGKSEKIIRDLHKIIEKEAPEFVFSLIAKQFRDLYWVKIDSHSTGFPSWKIGKLKSQAEKFTSDQLKELIDFLSKIDVDVKTGRAELTSSLDLLFLKHLQ